MSVALGFVNNYLKSGNYTNQQWNPKFDVFFSHKWNKKSTLRVSTGMQTYSYSGNIYNDVILRLSELTWKRGNKELEDRVWWQSSLSNTWNVSSKFSVTGKAIYTVVFNQDNPLWEKINGYDGLVTTTTDDGTMHFLKIGPQISLKLFKKKLVFTGSADYMFWKMSGMYDRTDSFFSGNVSATWYGKNWYTAVSLLPAYTKADYSSIRKKYTNWIYTFTFGYNVKDLNLKFVAHNPFSSRLYSITTIDTEYYSQRRKNYSRFNSNVFSLQLTYSFSYGKKVSRNVSAPSDILDSGAMSVDD